MGLELGLVNFVTEASSALLTKLLDVDHDSLVVIFECLLAARSVVVGVVVALLLQLGQAVHQVIRGLVGDVREDPVHKRLVPLQLMLDGVTDISMSNENSKNQQ